MRLAAVIVVAWLIIGIAATVQRGYLKSNNATCARTSTVAGTIVVGPLNYVGVNPKITCRVPKPST
ncbi:MAG TPA: hypothetical protein VFG00_11255 [Acidothermaceae bacterium]|nr:hypothetical protein [Acidothermaceae bacterium]